MVNPITTCHPETSFVVWPGNEKRRQECCKGSNNYEGGREETSRKAQTEVDGQIAVQANMMIMKEHQFEPKVAQKCEAWRNAVMAIDPGKG